MEEIWKPINGYEDFYCVSNFGNVKSFKKDKILVGNLTRKGYHKVGLSIEKVTKTVTTHRLVASHFLENTEQKPCVNHKDCDKTNNNVENLEWVTYSENNVHNIKMGRRVYAHNRSNSKLTVENVNYIRNSKMSSTELAKVFNVSISNISLIRNNKIWVGC